MQTKFYKLAFYILLIIFICSLLRKEDINEQCRLTKLSHLIIPFHMNQLKALEENIQKWSKYKPCTGVTWLNRPRLLFYVSYTDYSEIDGLSERLSNLKGYFSCFSNRDKIEIVEYKILKENDKHILGAREMFENCLKKNHPLFTDLKYIYYMEPDCRPIKSNWLTAIQNEIGTTNFWMKGAFFRGKYEFHGNDYLPNKYHINGNSIYNMGDEKFSQFYFQTLRPYIMRHRDSITAYDTDISEYLMDINNYLVVRNILHNFVLTEVVLNLWRQDFNVDEVIKLYGNSYLVHGGNPSNW